eukprot:9471167-Pyramimonas_sp.AAC.1
MGLRSRPALAMMAARATSTAAGSTPGAPGGRSSVGICVPRPGPAQENYLLFRPEASLRRPRRWS